ncbi:hypothetical protein ACFQFC_29475 [Amorphoplanes digitatis]|uniref:Tat pathway signal sequence domain protein n=1 Tax=Actinoplanes digitatis TaxID=1868 RepID=A0A7W7MN83_9ACTN|nr:hypothetical protein [Actinoplanes digitatis]MBB4760280.1 hypothetical protein [Actinoplanes digitatis]GID98133.1 hypothetical protein Adi01nite_75450 [Actinoplanes digitatis]
MPTNFSTAAGPFSRRRLQVLPAAVAAPLLAPEAAAAAGTCQPRHLVDQALAEPAGRAYHYLDVVQDAYVKGGEPRLLQSYNNESGLMTTAFVYDNALATLAYLASPTVANVRRARLIGDALLWAQANDEAYADGRVRQAYAAGPMLFYGGGPGYPGLRRADGKAAYLRPYGFGGSSTGDMAWVALALAQLYADTRITKYLDGAVALGHWIAARESPYRYGGYHGGVQGDGETVQRWASTEHNIDAYGLFTLLAKLTRDRRWTARAAGAVNFVRAMWNRAGPSLCTGTLGGEGEDPNQINLGNIPEDAQTWALLSVGDPEHRGAVDWVTRNLWNTDGAVSGVTYSSQAKLIAGDVSGSTIAHHRDAVWLEGNGHAALALLRRGGRGDAALARRLLSQIVTAQESLGAGQTVGRTADPDDGRLRDPADGGTLTGTPLPARSGIVAATSALDTGFDFGYFARQHVGATSWFLMAAQNFNPFR